MPGARQERMLRVHLRRRQVVRSRRYAAIGIILLPSDQYTIVNTRPSVYDSMCTVVGVAVGICSLEYCNLYDRRYTAVGITTVVGLRPSVYIRCLRPSVYIHWYTAVGFMHDHCISRALRALIPMYHPYREYRLNFNRPFRLWPTCSEHGIVMFFAKDFALVVMCVFGRSCFVRERPLSS